MQPSSFGGTPRGLQQQHQVPQAALRGVDRLNTAQVSQYGTHKHMFCRYQASAAASTTSGVLLTFSTAVPQQHIQQQASTLQEQLSSWRPWQVRHVPKAWGQCTCRKPVVRCSSSAADNQLPDASLQQQQQQQQPQQQQQQSQQLPQQQGDTSSAVAGAKQQSPIAMPHLMHMQPPPQPVSVPPLLAWLPPSLLLHLRALAGFLTACWGLLHEFHAPHIGEALRRLVLVLGASLALIVVVSTIDSGWLYMYLLNARRVPVAA